MSLDGYRRLLVNVAQAGAIAGIAKRTVHLWIQLGRVETIRTASGQIRIYADTLFQRDPRGRKPKSATAVASPSETPTPTASTAAR
jgi:predicted site-specific integrase-resolvase